MPACRLKGALRAALAAYLQVLDDWTLAELVGNRKRLVYLQTSGPPAFQGRAGPSNLRTIGQPRVSSINFCGN